MEILLLISALLAYVALVVITSVQPRRSGLSTFELARLKDAEKTVRVDIAREQYFADVVAWLRVVAGLLLVIFVLTLVAALGWVLGVLLAVIGVLEYVALARVPFVQAKSQKLYDKCEPKLLQFAKNYGARLAFLRGVTVGGDLGRNTELTSREELLHLVQKSHDVLTQEEKRRIESGLEFSGTRVADVMTPRTVIDLIHKDELLGPLTLDELHKTGRSRFPVIAEDIDHVVGVLHLRDVVSLQNKKSVKVSAAMKTPVYYIKDTQSLQHALAAFLKTHHLLFVVVNEYRETVGVITLEDVLEALLGRKIMDEFDAHEDLRAVAARNPKGNNQPNKHHDV